MVTSTDEAESRGTVAAAATPISEIARAYDPRPFQDV